MKNIYVGIDISKETLDFCIKKEQQFGFEKIENKKSAIRKAFKELNEKDTEIYIAMENTGNYNFKIYTVLEEFDFNAYVIDPRHIKQSIGLTRGKNDKIDARRITVFIEKNHRELGQWKPETQAIQTLRVLMTERRFKIKMRAALKQKNTEMGSVISNEYTKRSKELNNQEIKKLSKDIKEIETLIRSALAEDKELNNEIKRIQTIPGIGEITAWTLAAKTKGFTRLTDPRKLGCYAGVVQRDVPDISLFVSRGSGMYQSMGVLNCSNCHLVSQLSRKQSQNVRKSVIDVVKNHWHIFRA